MAARTIDETAREIVDASFKIHQGLGPGLLESVYQGLLARDLQCRGLIVEVQRSVTFQYDGMTFNQGLTVDLLLDSQVIVELKSVEKLAPVHFKQVRTYLKLLDLRLGFLINFGGALLKDNIHRIVNGLRDGEKDQAKKSPQPENLGEPSSS